MTPNQAKRALRLYKVYKCDTREYRELAAEIGINTGELNQRCWQMTHPKTVGAKYQR